MSRPLAKLLVCTAASAGVFSLTNSTSHAALTYNFDTPGTESQNNGHGDGALNDGWTDTVGQSRATFTIPGGRTSVVPGDQDSQNNNMVFSSPAFFLTGTTISVDLSGGQGNGPSAGDPANFPKNISDITAGPAGQDVTNVLILGLRNVTTGNYVSYLQKNQLADAWSTYTWDVTGLNDGTTQYAIDQIDTRYGGWGHIELDNVSIPGTLVPEPAGLAELALGAVGLLSRRRQSASR